MPTTSQKALRKFLLNLVEKPQALHQLKMNPSGFIKKSTIAKSHKQILLGSNLKKIKVLISRAAKPEFGWVIGPQISAGFVIHGDPKGKPVQISLRQSASKSGNIVVSAIHIKADPDI